MNDTVENEYLRVAVSDMGAELQSVLHKQGRGELLGRAPCLGICSKFDAPYVLCIEPWFGADDSPQAISRASRISKALAPQCRPRTSLGKLYRNGGCITCTMLTG